MHRRHSSRDSSPVCLTRPLLLPRLPPPLPQPDRGAHPICNVRPVIVSSSLSRRRRPNAALATEAHRRAVRAAPHNSLLLVMVQWASAPRLPREHNTSVSETSNVRIRRSLALLPALLPAIPQRPFVVRRPASVASPSFIWWFIGCPPTRRHPTARRRPDALLGGKRAAVVSLGRVTLACRAAATRVRPVSKRRATNRWCI